MTVNFGADFTITPRVGRHDPLRLLLRKLRRSWLPDDGTLFIWQTDGLFADGASDNSGSALPASLQQGAGFFNDPFSGTFTRKNSNKATQFDADLAWFKSGWGGTHNFKFGYQLNRLQNDILQSYNEPYVQLFVGDARTTVLRIRRLSSTGQLKLRNVALALFRR